MVPFSGTLFACWIFIAILPFLTDVFVHAGNPFSSNVVALTARNFRTEVEEYPHAVFISMCREGCGYCQRLAPEWEKLAAAVKGTVKIAYWDTEQAGRRPSLLGEIQGTPTIRLYIPKKKQKDGGNSKKVVLDYNYERKATDMKRFLDENMPEFIEKVSGVKGLEKFQNKAERYGLPQAILFTSKAKTLPLTKFLSTEFRRRILLAEVHPTKPNKEIMEKFNVVDLPALLVIPAGGGDPIKYQGNGFTRNKLQPFLSKYALKEKVVPPSKAKESSSNTTGTTTDEKETQAKEKVNVGGDGEL
jgi:protein disulfide-isomerase A6